jgi:hypothetical protein
MFGTVRAVPRLGELYPGVCLTTEGEGGYYDIMQRNANPLFYLKIVYNHNYGISKTDEVAATLGPRNIVFIFSVVIGRIGRLKDVKFIKKGLC